MEVRIGTSGWHYPTWIGRFYPGALSGYKELEFYSSRFNTVENNSSFYGMAKPATYEKWKSSTPEGFVFSLKMNRLFTHDNQLKLNPELKSKLVGWFNDLQTLGEKLGVILIQLPPSLNPDLELLGNFLGFVDAENKLEYKLKFAIEFRHEGWFSEDTYELLQKHNIALCISQSSRYPLSKQVTADFMYLRFHGPEKLFDSAYSVEDLRVWADYIQDQAIDEVYVYFNNTYHGQAIDNAEDFIKCYE